MSDGSEESRRRKAARRLFGAAGRMLDRAIVRAEVVTTEVVNAADILLMESQEGVYTEMHRRFTEKADRGEGGIESALEALDAMWENARQLRGGATAILHTLSARDANIQDRLPTLQNVRSASCRIPTLQLSFYASSVDPDRGWTHPKRGRRPRFQARDQGSREGTHQWRILWS